MSQTPASDPNPHKPADDAEVVYFEGSPRVRGELGKVIVYGIIGLAIIVLAIYGALKWSGWSLLAIIPALILMVAPAVAAMAIRYRITNYRIDFERGLISKRIDTLELWHVEDIQFYQSLIDRIVGVGTITVLSHDDTTPRLVMHGLPDPRPIFESLKQRVISVKRQRGVIKMDTGA